MSGYFKALFQCVSIVALNNVLKCCYVFLLHENKFFFLLFIPFDFIVKTESTGLSRRFLFKTRRFSQQHVQKRSINKRKAAEADVKEPPRFVGKTNGFPASIVSAPAPPAAPRLSVFSRCSFRRDWIRTPHRSEPSDGTNRSSACRFNAPRLDWDDK